MVPDSKRECSDTIPPEFLERVTALEEKSLSYSRTIPTEPDPCTKNPDTMQLLKVLHQVVIVYFGRRSLQDP